MNATDLATEQEWKDLVSDDKQLLLEIGTNDYAIAIIDNLGQILYLKLIPLAIKDDVNFTITDKDFKKVTIGLYSTQYLLVPNELYDKNNTPIYSQFVQTNNSDSYFDYEISSKNITALSIFDECDITFINQRFPSSKVFPSYVSYLKFLLEAFENKENYLVCINFKINSFEIAILSNGELLSFSIQEFFNQDELLYFIILHCKNQSLDLNEVTVHCSGLMNENSPSYQILKSTFKEIIFLNPNNNKLMKPELIKDNSHQFVSLINLLSCE